MHNAVSMQHKNWWPRMDICSFFNGHFHWISWKKPQTFDCWACSDKFSSTMPFPRILTFESKGTLISHRPFHHNLLVELFYSKKTFLVVCIEKKRYWYKIWFFWTLVFYTWFSYVTVQSNEKMTGEDCWKIVLCDTLLWAGEGRTLGSLRNPCPVIAFVI